MLRRRLLASGKIFILYLAVIASAIDLNEAKEKSKNNKASKYKLTSVLSALAPDKNVPAVLNRTKPNSNDDGKSKKKDILANVMNQLGTDQVRSFSDQQNNDGQVTEVSEPPRDYDLTAHRRMEDAGAPRVINLPGMINVFGPPPKSRFSRPRQDPLHVLQMPELSGRSPRENYEVVPPQFNSENIPVHFYPNVRPPEITGGKPRHLFLPFPRRYEPGLHPRGLHSALHEGLHGGINGGLHGGFHGGLNEAADDDAVAVGNHEGLDGYRVAGLAPFHHDVISEFAHLHPASGVPLAAADQFDDVGRHVNIEGHEMGRFITMPPPSITAHPPKHLFIPGKEVTLDNGREYNMNNEMHVVEHGHHRHHQHFHDHVDGDDHFSHYGDHDDHDDDHGDDQVVVGGDDGDSYDSHGSPVSVADPEHVVHEHHNVEHHHHFGKLCLNTI